MRILLFLAVWQRPEITEICFMGLRRLMNRIDFEVSSFAVISEDSMIPLCEKYGIEYCFYKNEPLGEKKNYGISKAMEKDFDYLIELGSDDLIKDGILDLYKPYLGYRDLLGLTSLCIIDSHTGRCKVTEPKSSFGLGRAISKEGIKRASIRNNGSFNLWESTINSGLDNNSEFRMAISGVFGKRIHSDEPLAIDIKSSVNIHSFESIQGITYPIELALKGISEEEKTAIRCLITKSKSENLISV